MFGFKWDPTLLTESYVNAFALFCSFFLTSTSSPVESDRPPPASAVNWMQFFWCIPRKTVESACYSVIFGVKRNKLCAKMLFWKTKTRQKQLRAQPSQPSELAACDSGAAAAAASTVWMPSEPSLSWATLHFRYLSKYQAEQTGTLLFQSEWKPNCLWGLKWNCSHTKQ